MFKQIAALLRRKPDAPQVAQDSAATLPIAKKAAIKKPAARKAPVSKSTKKPAVKKTIKKK